MRFSQILGVFGIALAAVPLAIGCAQVPRIDPSGERLLAWDTPAAGPIVTAPVTNAPVFVTPGATVVTPSVAGVPTLGTPMFVQPGLTLTPLRIVAPVGTEVLMVAGVHGAGDPLLTGQRVEWMLAPGSVGTFLAVGEREGPNFLRWFGTPPQKVSNDYAVTETVSVARIITRGTIDPADDVSVLPGQAWVTLSSPIEGSSHVTAFAPELVGTTGNQQSGVIHWVDARWNAPPSATVPTGMSHAMTTTVVRHSTGMPAAGYKVRYEVVSGPAAGFGPAASGGVELTTDGQGIATAEIVQRSPQSGVTDVSVQLVRPAGIVPGSELLVLGNTTTRITWVEPAAVVTPPATPGVVVTPSPGVVTPAPTLPTTPTMPTRPSVPIPVAQPLEVRITGPERATVGERVQFQIDITNRSAAAIDKLIVVDRFDAGLRHAKDDRQIQRDIGAIAAGQTRSIQVIFDVVAPGRLCHTVEVTGSGNERASANACINAIDAPVTETPSIKVSRTAPRQMRVDEKAVFQIAITNNGGVPIPSLRVVETWQRGLNPVQASPEFKKNREGIVAEIDRPLAPGDTTTLQVEYIATEVAPRACAQATVTGGRDVAQVDEVCVDIGPPSPSDAPAAGKLELTISERSDPVRVEQLFSYRVVIRNTGPTPQRNVVLSVNVPDAVSVESINRPQDQFKIVGRTITFNPIVEMPPDDALSFDLHVKAVRPGMVQAEASVASQTITQAITKAESTEILGR